MRYIFRGETRSDSNVDGNLTKLESTLSDDLALPHPGIRVTIDALDQLGQKLLGDRKFLIDILTETGLSEPEAQSAKKDVAAILNKKTLHLKVKRELSEIPLEITRPNVQEPYLEGYIPIGILGHVTSSNDAFLPFLSAVEGLITGNINILKTAAGGGHIAAEMAAELCSIEPRLNPYLYIFPISSKEKERLKKLFACCSAIAVWGSDAAVKGVSELTPAEVEIIPWGHRISFAYVTKAGNSKNALEGIARDVCVNDQQACSAPQIVYYETENKEELTGFAKQLYSAMNNISPAYPEHSKDDSDWAELTTQTELAKLSEIMGDGAVFCGKGFRIFVKPRSEPETSPLFRTVLVKSIKRTEIIKILRPYRSYLQSVGLTAAVSEIAELSNLLYMSGVTRIVSAGMMAGGYIGEPHDGVYALSRYVRRVSLENHAMPETITDLNEISGNRLTRKPFPGGTAIIRKADIPNLSIDKNQGYLLLKSGGSSGKAVYAPHTYSDAEMTYITAGRAMFAAGIKSDDVCMNLFYSGSLYGGFISMYEGLKHIDAIQLPMAANMDFAFVAGEIISNRVTVLMGMPSYLLRLFSEQREMLKGYGGIRMVLYGGEHFDPKQIAYIKNEFGVSGVKSIAYGCNEIGPIGYVCEFCRGAEHHLFSSKYMEILKPDADKPAADGETGRIVISNFDKENIDVNRYEIGDLGRFLTEPCPCGRSAPRFELKGRFGDIFKFASNYVNYSLIKSVLAERLDYVGNLQIVLEYGDKDTMTVCVDQGADAAKLLEALYAYVPEINETISDKTGNVVISPQDSFIISGAGGKVRNVVDMRL